MDSTRKQGCGNPNCGISTGICERWTFGNGKLDNHGYWENPCGLCAEAFLERNPDLTENDVWPQLVDPPENTETKEWADLALQHFREAPERA